MIVREMASEADMWAVLSVGKRMHEESNRYSALSEWKWPVAERYGRAILADPDHWRCFMAERDGKCVGFFIAKVRPFGVFTDALTAWEGTFYVIPEARGTSAFPRMLKAAEAWARSRGASLMTVIFSAGLSDGSGLERYGYTADGAVYRKEL